MESTRERTENRTENKGKTNDFREMMLRRTKKLGVDTLYFIEDMPKNHAANAIAEQLLESAVAVGVKYRSSSRASKDDFEAKFSAIAAETDKFQYWIELLMGMDIGSGEKLAKLKEEAGAIGGIAAKSLKTRKEKNNNKV